MSAYNTFNPPPALLPGDDKWVIGTSFAAAAGPTSGMIQTPNDGNVVMEAALAVGYVSQQVSLAPRPGGGAPAGLMVTAFANADPGVAEIDVVDAGVDALLNYLVPANAAYKLTVWTRVGNLWMSYTELQPEAGAFIALKVVLNPNGVGFIAKLRYI